MSFIKKFLRERAIAFEKWLLQQIVEGARSTETLARLFREECEEKYAVVYDATVSQVSETPLHHDIHIHETECPLVPTVAVDEDTCAVPAEQVSPLAVTETSAPHAEEDSTPTVQEGNISTAKEGNSSTAEEGNTPIAEEGNTNTAEEGNTSVAKESNTPTAKEGITPTYEEGSTPIDEEGNTPTDEVSNGLQTPKSDDQAPVQAEMNYKMQKALDMKEARTRKFREIYEQKAERARRIAQKARTDHPVRKQEDCDDHENKADNTSQTQDDAPVVNEVFVPTVKEVIASTSKDSDGPQTSEDDERVPTQAEINYMKKMQKAKELKEARARQFSEKIQQRADRAHRNRLASGRVAHIDLEFPERFPSPHEPITSAAASQKDAKSAKETHQVHQQRQAQAENTQHTASQAAVAPVRDASRQKGNRSVLQPRQEALKTGVSDSLKVGKSVKKAPPKVQQAPKAKVAESQAPLITEVTPWGLVRVIPRYIHRPASHCRTVDIINAKKEAAARTRQEKACQAREAREARAERAALARQEQEERVVRARQEKARARLGESARGTAWK